jgi:hypothetical protein
MEDNRDCSLWFILSYFISSKLYIHNQINCVRHCRNFINNTPFCYSFIIALQLSLTNVCQRNISENLQLLYSQHAVCCLIRHIIHLLTQLSLDWHPTGLPPLPSVSVTNRFPVSISLSSICLSPAVQESMLRL